ncbi:MAG: PEP-CTERM sorting domain-containing protein [Microcystis panniformis]
MTVTTVSLTLAAASGASAATVFGFQDAYDPINWTLTNSNADGFVNTGGAPASISLTGGNNGSFNFGTTDYTTTAAAAGTVTFDWDYSTNDDPGFDGFGYLLNGSFSFLTDSPNNGTSTFNVLAGDSFGFRVYTIDNVFGRGSVTISNFSAPIPEPSTVLSLLVLGGLGAGLKYLKRN